MTLNRLEEILEINKYIPKIMGFNFGIYSIQKISNKKYK
jgi:hypothetical protein